MSASGRTALRVILRGLSWILFGIAGASFLMGGRIISDSWHVDGILSEFFGMGIAAASFVAGYFLKSAADDYSAGEGQSLDDHE